MFLHSSCYYLHECDVCRNVIGLYVPYCVTSMRDVFHCLTSWCAREVVLKRHNWTVLFGVIAIYVLNFVTLSWHWVSYCYTSQDCIDVTWLCVFVTMKCVMCEQHNPLYIVKTITWFIWLHNSAFLQNYSTKASRFGDQIAAFTQETLEMLHRLYVSNSWHFLMAYCHLVPAYAMSTLIWSFSNYFLSALLSDDHWLFETMIR